MHAILFMTVQPIRHFRNAKGTGAEMSPAIVSGIATVDAPVSYWSFFPSPYQQPQKSLRKFTLPRFLVVSKVSKVQTEKYFTRFSAF